MQKFKTTLAGIQGLKKGKISRVNLSKSIFLGIALTVLSQNEAKAQLTATGQIRERTELRAGQGTLQKDGDKAGLFTSQRARLNIGFTGYRFKIYTSLQDVRVWGQDASSINRTTTEANNGILFHEAWGEIMLADTTSTIQNISLKVGRQEISYDDQKVLGGLDWLQQGRRHDAIVFKFANKGWIADVGAAFNQNKELNTGTVYNGVPTAYGAGTNGIGTMYKSFQYAYLGKKFSFGDVSFLFFKDDFNKYTSVTSGTPAVTTKVYGEGVWSRNTTGFYFNTNPTRKINLTGSVYHQGGKDKDGRSISANLASVTSTLQVGRKLFVGPGIDYLSGTDGTKAVTATSESNLFDPLYGTPHKFWGSMDYFYAANGFGKQGLLNYFFKVKYNAKDNLTFLLDVHAFEAANTLSNGAGGKLDSYLGTELDLLVKYNLTKMINIEAGYSIIKATNSMASAAVKNITTPDLTPQFAYVMLNIKPNFLAKK
ncbi:alginate export family protein [Flavobacterium lacustre]|uniref:alginate export family protein n=1 Tax=Flavobacterium lacustre TaxID=3016339 RepID=UPI0022B619BC|nr:alginate export family protein [Flavobacterium lacustre]